MEQNQDKPLFGLNIDPITKTHLSGAATWAKFLAIMGFIVCGLIVLVGIFAKSLLSSTLTGYESFGGQVNTDGYATILAIVYILIALLYFFPCLFLYHFATKMRVALAADNQEMLNASFLGLKKTFRYLGILTIIIIGFYFLIFLMAIVAGGTM